MSSYYWDTRDEENTVLTYTLRFLFQGGTPPALGTECVRMTGCPNVCA